MNKEYTGKMDFHVSHNLSSSINTRRHEKAWDQVKEVFAASKIEVRYSEMKGV